MKKTCPMCSIASSWSLSLRSMIAKYLNRTMAPNWRWDLVQFWRSWRSNDDAWRLQGWVFRLDSSSIVEKSNQQHRLKHLAEICIRLWESFDMFHHAMVSRKGACQRATHNKARRVTTSPLFRHVVYHQSFPVVNSLMFRKWLFFSMTAHELTSRNQQSWARHKILVANSRAWCLDE